MLNELKMDFHSALCTVQDLCGVDDTGNPLYRFFVPKYQRGYRWTDKQVTDLLEDINAFIPITQNGSEMSWYCLQPLVIRFDKTSKHYNLVDGQQRLSTVYLLLKYLNEGLAEKRRKPLYDLTYETRKKWLDSLDGETPPTDNIDYWHISKAYETIKRWFGDHPKVDEDAFRGKLSSSCKFIWYDIEQGGAVKAAEEDVFIRLNIGKIQLTNAELIKALFLNRTNFGSKDDETIRLRQLEISSQWDIMEEELSDDAFWYFINGKANLATPRINFLFEILAEKPLKTDDDLFTFRHFQARFDSAKISRKLSDFIKEEWQSVHCKYQILRDWFHHRFYYHHIGLLLTHKSEDIAELLRVGSEYPKDEFRAFIVKRIKSIIKWDGEDVMEYGTNTAQIRWILLLHNVLTTQRHEKDNAWFPFDLYHSTQWDIEHIQAVADPELLPDGKVRRVQWLESAIPYIEDEILRDEASGFEAFEDSDKFQVIYQNIVEYFSATDTDCANAMSLSNLALLDYKTNRGYGNAVFPAKRAFILEKDQEDRFRFIPVCTKNVFYKYYTRTTLGDLSRWTMLDRENYLNDIKFTLKDYLTTDNESN